MISNSSFPVQDGYAEIAAGISVVSMENHELIVEKVAKLARLEITQAEKEAFAKQLSQILTHVEKLKQYNTKGIGTDGDGAGGP